MAEPIGIAAGALAFASFVYDSLKKVNEFIYTLRHPKLRDLRQDLEILQNITRSLQADLEQTRDADLNPNQRDSLKNLRGALESCKITCDVFYERLQQIFSHSDVENISKYDTVRLHFNEKEIDLFRSNLQQCKTTLSIALEHLKLKNDARSESSLQQLNDTIASFMSESSGQLQGLRRAMDVLSVAGARISKTDVDVVVSALNTQATMLKRCLMVCEGALKDTATASPGISVRNNKVLGKARMIIAHMGGSPAPGVSINVGDSETSGEGRTFVLTGAIDAASLSMLSDPKH